MRKCDAYYRRKELLKHNEFPLQKEILQRHKTHLASVLNEYIGKPIKFDIGTTPPLNGAKDDLWVSPSDLLIPRVRLKPPLTSKYVRALTHNGILEFGREIQEKYQNELLNRFDVEMRLLADKLNFVCEKETTKAVVEERVRCEKKLRMEIRRIEHEYQNQLEEQVTKLKSHMLMEQQKKLDKQKQIHLAEASRQIMEAVNENANSLIKQFQFELEIQAQKHIKDLGDAIRSEEEKISKALKNANADKLEALRILRHDLECRNMANLMYILTAERHRCDGEKQKIYDEYKIMIDDMNTLALDLYKEMQSLESLTNDYRTKFNKYYAFIEQLLCEFQYFINYTFESTPSQCEYLLNLNEYINNEMRNDLSSLPTSTRNWIHDDSSNKLPLRPIDLITRNDKEWFLPTRYQNKMDNNTDYGIFKLDEDSPIPSKQTLSSKDDLTHLLYNKYVYVREDFRNRKTLDIPEKYSSLWMDRSESSSNSICNVDISLKPTYPTSSTVHFLVKPTDEYDTDTNGLSHCSIKNAEQSFSKTSQLSANSEKINEKEQPHNKRSFSSHGSILRRSSKTSKSVVMINSGLNRKPSFKVIKEERDDADDDENNYALTDSPSKLSTMQVISGHTNKHSSRLLVTRNSIILHASRKFSSINEKLHMPLVISDANTNRDNSLKLRKVAHKIAQNGDDHLITPSNLALSHDSVELIRKKSILKSKSDAVHQPPRISNVTSSISFKLPTHDEIMLYTAPSTKSTRSDDRKRKSVRKSIENDDPSDPQSIVSKLTLATDSIELLKQRSSKQVVKRKTNQPRLSITSKGKLIYTSSPKIKSSSSKSSVLTGKSDLDNNKNNYKDIIMDWSEANQVKINNNMRPSLTYENNIIRPSRVAIIEEPVNVILPTFNEAQEDEVNPFVFDNLDIIDKQIFDEPNNNHYYPLQLQTPIQPINGFQAKSLSDEMHKAAIKKQSSKIVSNVNMDHTNLTPEKFFEKRSEYLKKFSK